MNTPPEKPGTEKPETPKTETPEDGRLILEITSHRPDGAVIHRAVESFPATLGRGYHNDIILGDPHVSASHISIDRAEDGFIVTDLDSENGMLLNNRRQPKGPVRVGSGDMLRIGLTDIRVFSPAHPVPAAARLARPSQLASDLSRSVVVWPLLAGAAAMLGLWTYLQTATPDIGQALAVTVAVALLVIIVWSALWAVAGRLIRNKSRFRSHVSLISAAMILAVVFYYVEACVGFLTNEDGLGTFIDYTLSGLFLAAVIRGALELATDMSARRRALAGLFFAGGLMGAVFLLGMLGNSSFSPLPPYAAQLEPYLSKIAIAKTPKDFMADNEALFKADTFNEKKSGGN
ncbi:MAG: FHA domain-containing protein [Alphaproteobacteria bacterium]|nr:FHA domain-containing protein [Alphaproteobacteria bacterium]